MKFFFRRNTLSRYFVKNFIFMLLVFTLPVDLLIAGLFIYQNNYAYDRIINEGRSELSRIQSKLDSMITTAQKANIALSADVAVRRFASIQTYQFNIDTKNQLSILQRLFLDTEKNNPFLDIVIAHFRIPNAYVSSQSAQTFFTSDKMSNNTRFAYELMKKYENIGLIQAMDTDQQYLYFYTNIVIEGELRGGIASRCMMTTLIDEIERNLSNKMDKLFIISTNDGLILDSNRKGYSTSQQFSDMQHHELLIHSDGQLIHYNEQSYIVISTPSEFYDWNYLLLYTEGHINKTIQNNMQIMVAFIFLSTISMMGAAYWLTIKFHKPLDVVVKVLADPDQTMSRQYDMLLQHVSELGIIQKMLEKNRLHELFSQHKLIEQQKQLELIENQALRSQINPHFIYNTLESINWKIMTNLGLENAASEMVMTLSRLLRLSFRSRDKYVLLREELDHAKLYMQLQKARFKDRFTVEWNVDPDTMELQVLPLMLQPVFENAILHGCTEETGKSVIIRCECVIKSELLLILISDTGVGIPQAQLKRIQMQLENSSRPVDDHIGLNNTHRRIVLTFGETYGLMIESKHPCGTQVKITLPLVK